MKPTPQQAQFIRADQLKTGDTLIFHGGTHETVRKLQPQRGGKLLVKTSGHPEGVLANNSQSVSIVPR